ncbi:hypothetical protein E3N88_37253 [Mikania micrantha]|uniref:Uncharacterized protein n=1 Tax=Mikania micrantha TaxID=192012 RepID=A0A5N6M8N1_9ASTR|nr:hypothetical protein E3N88_37253 [Mikania micrantha]
MATPSGNHLLQYSSRSNRKDEMTNMELDECEETTLHDVNIEEDMRRKQQTAQEAYEEDEDMHGGGAQRGLARPSVGEYKVAEEVHIKAIQIDEKSVEAYGHLAQGILKLGQSRDDKLRRVTLQVDEEDIIFCIVGTTDTFNFLNMVVFISFGSKVDA